MSCMINTHRHHQDSFLLTYILSKIYYLWIQSLDFGIDGTIKLYNTQFTERKIVKLLNEQMHFCRRKVHWYNRNHKVIGSYRDCLDCMNCIFIIVLGTHCRSIEKVYRWVDVSTNRSRRRCRPLATRALPSAICPEGTIN